MNNDLTCQWSVDSELWFETNCRGGCFFLETEDHIDFFLVWNFCPYCGKRSKQELEDDR